ncbi:tetratricopeptide repeat protein [Pseudodesulfovibrio sp. S3]|uniref:tetratricopeptide repeat protein n=2 Tax=unclassified Pseudodesulfovibrio TaxID=2661612 RepID=UPI000FEC026E|nr:tetratricopeptide repeat protein [Pseudodesulfovibrio sp. S3]MCJ2165958.1 tetratricopeptide repeat protein [Pseudodesulfovibrio sp. S3-i]
MGAFRAGHTITVSGQCQGKTWAGADGAGLGRVRKRYPMTQDRNVSPDGRDRLHRMSVQGHAGQVCCIFSSAKSHHPGQGTTLRGHGSVHYWLVRQVGKSAYAVRGVDGDFLPFGSEVSIQVEELLALYSPEVAVFEDRLVPAASQGEYLVEGGRGQGVRRSVIRIDEANVRALFRLAQEYILARRVSKGKTLLNELLRLKTPFSGKNQFLFNEFGISLRKIGFPEGAVICYRRALQHTEVDDHLYYNLSRAYYEQGQWWDCMTALVRCFELNPAMPLARDLLVLISALAGNPALRVRYGKPPVPTGVARQAGLLCESTFTHDAGARARAEAESLEAEERDAATEGQADANLWLPGRDAVGV